MRWAAVSGGETLQGTGGSPAGRRGPKGAAISPPGHPARQSNTHTGSAGLLACRSWSSPAFPVAGGRPVAVWARTLCLQLRGQPWHQPCSLLIPPGRLATREPAPFARKSKVSGPMGSNVERGWGWLRLPRGLPLAYPADRLWVPRGAIAPRGETGSPVRSGTPAGPTESGAAPAAVSLTGPLNATVSSTREGGGPRMTASQKTGPEAKTGVSPGVGLEPIGPSAPCADPISRDCRCRCPSRRCGTRCGATPPGLYLLWLSRREGARHGLCMVCRCRSR